MQSVRLGALEEISPPGTAGERIAVAGDRLNLAFTECLEQVRLLELEEHRTGSETPTPI